MYDIVLNDLSYMKSNNLIIIIIIIMFATTQLLSCRKIRCSYTKFVVCIFKQVDNLLILTVFGIHVHITLTINPQYHSIYITFYNEVIILWSPLLRLHSHHHHYRRSKRYSLVVFNFLFFIQTHVSCETLSCWLLGRFVIICGETGIHAEYDPVVSSMQFL